MDSRGILYSRADAARALRVTSKTIGRWIARGIISAKQRGHGAPMIPATEIARLARLRRYKSRRKYAKRDKGYWR